MRTKICIVALLVAAGGWLTPAAAQSVKHIQTDQPNKPARSTVQVAALVAAGAFLEVEVQAARSR